MADLRSYAKINLGLEITGRRPDGYHTLRSVFQTISLHDRIRVRPRRDGRVIIRGDDPAIDWEGANTIRRAIELLAGNYPVGGGFEVRVRKRIPAGAGLGGGSSNAAAMLLYINEFAALNLPLSRLIELSAAIGADVPFFLLGGTALAEGIGDQLTPLPDLPARKITLCVPKLHVSTALVFSRFALTNERFPSRIEIFLRSGSLSILQNELEAVTMSLFPEIRVLKDRMNEMGFAFVQMTGSGSAVYGVRSPSTRPAHPGRAPLPGSVRVNTVDRQTYLETIGVWPSGKASAFGAEIRRFESSRPSFHS